MRGTWPRRSSRSTLRQAREASILLGNPYHACALLLKHTTRPASTASGVYLWRSPHGHWYRVDNTRTHRLGKTPDLTEHGLDPDAT